MPSALAEYHRLEGLLWLARLRSHGEESATEDALLDEMDAAWRRLSAEERATLNHEGARCWPNDPTCWPPDFVATINGPDLRRWRYEGFTSIHETILSEGVA